MDVVGVGFRGSDRGAALPFLALVLVFFSLVSLLLIGLVERVADRAQAQAAADAAALAGVIDGRSGAASLAQRNGAELVEFDAGDNTVTVVVEVEGWRAEARAERRLSVDTSG